MTTAHDIAAQQDKVRRAYEAYVAAVTELDDAVSELDIAVPDGADDADAVEDTVDRVFEAIERLDARNTYGMLTLDRAVAALTDIAA